MKDKTHNNGFGMDVLSYYDWLWIAECRIGDEPLSYPKRVALRFVIGQIEEGHQNDFRYLEPAFVDTKHAELFALTWSAYCDYLMQMRAIVRGHIEWIFEDGEREGIYTRCNGGDVHINAAWWYARTGKDPVGVFSAGDLEAIEATFTEPEKAETKERTFDWLIRKIKKSDANNEGR